MKTLKDATVEELKAAAYDTLRNIEIQQNNLRIINEEITNKEKMKRADLPVGTAEKVIEKKNK